MNLHLLGKRLRNRYLWGLLTLVIGAQLHAQDITSYVFATNTTSSLALDANANVIDMSTGTNLLVANNSDQGVSGVTNIGFAFPFLGGSYTQFTASANGLIGLGGTALAGASYSTNPATATFPHLAPIAGDLMTGAGGKVHNKVFGTAPNRTLVVEFLNMSLDYVGVTGTNDGTFQVRLYEATGVVEYVYGPMFRNTTATNSPTQTFNIGMAIGTTATTRVCVDTNNVTSYGALVVNNYPLNSNMNHLNSAANGSRRAYTFTPPVMTYASSQVTAPFSPIVGQNIANAVVARLEVVANGVAPLTMSSIDVQTTGTSNLSDITNLKIYYTGTSTTFSTTTQFGTTVASPAASQAVTGSQLIANGTNYFWVTYDVAPAATPGNSIDAEISSFTLGGNSYNPSPSAPAGSRLILGPMSGDYMIGSGHPFTTITEAVASINERGANGAVRFILASPLYNTLSGEVFPITINAYPGMSATNTLSIYPMGGVMASVIEKSAGPLFILNGAKYVTVDGRQGGIAGGTPKSLTIQNDSAGATAAAITLRNDASYNNLQFAIFKGSGTAATTGVINFGTGVTTGNDSNFIAGCDIGDAAGGYPSTLIQSLGSTDVVAKYNDYIRVTECNLFNFWNTSAEANGFKVSNGNNYWTISNNSIYQTSVTGKRSSSGYYSFNFQNSDNFNALNGMVVTGNYIGGSAPVCNGTPWLQDTSAGTLISYFKMGNQVISRVSNNVFANINIISSATGTTGAGAWNAIQYVNGMLNIDSNIIGSLSDTGSIVIRTGSAGVVLPISVIASNTAGTYSITANKIGGIRVYGGGTVSTNISLINITTSTSSQTYNIRNNVLGNSVADNIIAWPSSSSTAQSIRGINNTSAANLRVTSNTIQNFTNQYRGSGSGVVIGLATSSGIDTISLNTIHSMSALSASTSVQGIAVTGGTTMTTFRNKIYNLNDSAGSVIGVNITGATTNTVVNNMIGDLKTPNANAANNLIGISITGGTTSNIYYNTVALNGTSIGTNFGSSAISVSTSPTVNLRNNIFTNTSVPNGTGISAAYRRSGTSLTSYGSVSNNNLFYAGAPSATTVIYTDGTNLDQTMTTYKTRVGNRDSLSVTENPSFTSTTGSAPDFLNIIPSTQSQIESGAINITSPAITADFYGNVRQGNPGYPAQANGGGTRPDIGAFEYDGAPLSAPSITGIAASPSAIQCTAAPRTVTVTVNPGSGSVSSVMLNYSFDGVAQPSTPMTNTSGNNWSGSIPAATPGYAVVTWSVSAVNSFSLTNLATGTSYKDQPLSGYIDTILTSVNPVCLGKSASLKSVLLGPGGPVAVGTGALATTTAGAVVANRISPYYHYYGNIRNQFMIRASELTAAGLYEGHITALAFDVVAPGATYNGFNIAMTSTTLPDLSGAVPTGFSNVFSAASVTPVAGINRYTFTTPFYWDGTSNVVIQVCWGNLNSGGTSTAVRYDNTTFVAQRSVEEDGAASTICAGSGTVTNSNSGRPRMILTGLNFPIVSYSWSDGSTTVGTTNPLSVSPTVNTTYSVTATDGNGCTIASSPTTINVINTAMTGTYTVGASGNYPTITAAINALNAICTLSGHVVFELTDANYNASTGEVFPIVISNNAAITSSTTLTIRPASGATPVISGNVAASLIRFSGAKHVIIDGRQSGMGTVKSLTIQNDSIAGSAITFVNDASHNTVEYAILKGASNNATNGVVNFGTGLVTGNDSNLIDHCDIGDGATTPATLVQALGSTDATAKYNDGNIISNCNLYNFWHASAESNAFKISNGNNRWIVTNNSIYQTAARSGSAGYYTFNLNNGGTRSALNGMQITNNYIGGSAPLCAGTPWTQTSSAATQLSYFNMGDVEVSRFSNNTVTNYDFTTTSTANTGAGVWNAVQYINGMMHIDSNIIGSLTDTAAIRVKAGTGSAVLPISIVASSTAGTYSVTANKLGGISAGDSLSNNISCIFITSAGNTITYNVEKNEVGVRDIRANALGTNTGQSVLGIYNTSSANLNIRNNIVHNLINKYNKDGSTTATAPGQTVGIGSTAGTNVISMNTVYDIENATIQKGTGALASVIGIGSVSTAANMDVAQNNVYNIRNAGGTTGVSVYGILYSGGTGVQTVRRNNVHSFSSTADSTVHVGIYALAGTGRIQNNMIRLGVDGTGSSVTNSMPITGIRIAGGNIRLFFNSVFIGGTVTAGNVNTYALERTATGTDSLYNNIFVNERNGGSGIHAAVRLSATTSLKANYNLYYVGGGATLGILDVNAQAAISNWKVATGVDGSSNSGNPSFVNAMGNVSGVDLHITGTTPIEGSGLAIAGIENDFDGDLRSGLTPTDIGADAGNFTLSDIFPPSISYTLISSDTIGSVAKVLNAFATIIDPSGVDVSSFIPRLYYKRSVDSDMFTGNTSADQGWKYVTASNTTSPFSFSIDYSRLFGGVIAVGDTIQYFIAAQDMLGSVGANPSGSFSALSVNNITAAPSPVNYYRIKRGPLHGVYNVGAGQVAPNFTTLTSAIQTLNDVGVGSPVTFRLMDADYSTAETFPLVIEQAEGLSAANPLLIKPNTGVTTVISGTSATSIFKLNGADYVTIDGSNAVAGTTRDLTIRNTSGNGSTAAIWISSLGAGMGAHHITVNNTIQEVSSNANLTYGVFSGGTGITENGTGQSNSNLTLQNNAFRAARFGVYIGAPATDIATDVIIRNNKMDDISPNSLGRYGVMMAGVNNAEISGNQIGRFGDTATGAVKVGIYVKNNTTNAKLFNNNIYELVYLGTGGYTGQGIVLESATSSANVSNVDIYNNFISGMKGDGDSYVTFGGVYVPAGIYLRYALTNVRLLYNSIHLYGNTLNNDAECLSAGIAMDDGASAVVLNNIINNKLGVLNTTGFGAVGIFLEQNVSQLTQSNYNDIFCSITGSGVTLIGKVGAADYATMAAWRTATSNEANSQNVDVTFTSQNNLKLTGTSLGNTALIATPIAGITTDFEGETRNASFPYMGADENLANPLPVRLTLFTAAAKGQDVLVSWNTASETNNKGFDVERSADGKTFTKIGFVRGAGNSSRALSYSLTDAYAFKTTGSNTLYYRLRQIDFDNKASYSGAVLVHNDSKPAASVEIYPNPFAGKLQVHVSAIEAGNAAIKLFDIAGRMIAEKDVAVEEGTNAFELDNLESLRHGVYFISVTQQGTTTTQKVVKH